MVRKSARPKFAHKKVFPVPDEAIRGLRWVHGLLPFLPDDQVKAIKDDWFESIFGVGGRDLKAAWAAENLAAAAPARTEKKKERADIIRQKCEVYWTKHSGNGRRNAALTAQHLLVDINRTLKQAGHQIYTVQSLEKLVRKISRDRCRKDFVPLN
jgi:hypothetical protein